MPHQNIFSTNSRALETQISLDTKTYNELELNINVIFSPSFALPDHISKHVLDVEAPE